MLFLPTYEICTLEALSFWNAPCNQIFAKTIESDISLKNHDCILLQRRIENYFTTSEIRLPANTRLVFQINTSTQTDMSFN